MITGKSILITGHTGLIGGALYAALKERNAVRGHSRTKHDGEFDAEPDLIIHAAGYAQPSKFVANPFETISINTAWLMDLIAGMKPGARLLFLSSSEVYSGSVKYGHDERDIGTTGPDHARACYIEAKRCGEAICHAARAQGKDVVIARVSSVYGPGFQSNDTRVLSQFVRMALEEGHVSPKDGGPARRAWLYVDDCTEMLLNVLTAGKQPVYNIGGPSECTIATLAKKIADLSHASYRLPRNSGDASNGAPAHVRVDISRYGREFGEPKFVGMDEGLRRTIEWYRKTYDMQPIRAAV